MAVVSPAARSLWAASFTRVHRRLSREDGESFFAVKLLERTGVGPYILLSEVGSPNDSIPNPFAD